MAPVEGANDPGIRRTEGSGNLRANPEANTAFVRLMRWQKWLCGGLIVVMAMLIAAEVVSRELFDRSLQVTHELAGYLLVTVAFLGFGVSLYEQALFRVDFLFARLSARARNHVQILFDLLSLGFCLVLEYQLVAFVVSSFTRGYREATELATPLFIPQIAMPIGIAMTIVVLVSQVTSGVRRAIGRGA